MPSFKGGPFARSSQASSARGNEQQVTMAQNVLLQIVRGISPESPGSFMNDGSFPWTRIVLTVQISLVLYFIHVRYNTSLRTVPGPFLASLTRLWKVKTILGARQELVLLDLHRKHGICPYSSVHMRRCVYV